jgi:anti-anti-sigma factor
MGRKEKAFVPYLIKGAGQALAPLSHTSCVVSVHGPLRMPIDRELRHRIRSLLRRGNRRIVLDLAAVSRIDAAGVGELIRVYNMTVAVHGVLRIVHATDWVREILERVTLFDLLSGAGEEDLEVV